MSGKFCSFDPGPYLAESCLASGGSVIGKGSEAAIIRGPKLLYGQKGSRLEHAIADLSRSFDGGVDRIDYSDKDNVIGPDKLADDAQDAFSIRFAGHLQVETADPQLKEIRQQRCIINIGTVRGILVPSGTDMNSYAAAFMRSKAIENLVIERDKAAQQIPRGIELERQSSFSEVDLDSGCTCVERTPYVLFSFIDEIGQKRISGIARNS